MPCGQWFLFVSRIVVHTVDVFGVEVEHVGQIVRQWLLSGWWVGGEFLRHPYPNPAEHSSARTLLTGRETLMSSVCHRRASAERYPWR